MSLVKDMSRPDALELSSGHRATHTGDKVNGAPGVEQHRTRCHEKSFAY